MSKKTSGRNATAKQNEYISKTYDRINLLVPKGYKDRIKEAAERAGSSVNAYIVRAVDDAMQRDPERGVDHSSTPVRSAPAPAHSDSGVTDVPTPPRGEGG